MTLMVTARLFHCVREFDARTKPNVKLRLYGKQR